MHSSNAVSGTNIGSAPINAILFLHGRGVFVDEKSGGDLRMMG
jgi:hypothetical protein